MTDEVRVLSEQRLLVTSEQLAQQRKQLEIEAMFAAERCEREWQAELLRTERAHRPAQLTMMLALVPALIVFAELVWLWWLR